MVKMSIFIELVSPLRLMQSLCLTLLGRTGRAGNEGLATSFYNEGDEPLAPFLAKILVENGWEVPDFLEEYKPTEGKELDFNDDSGDEENEPVGGATQVNGDDDGAWGAGPAQAAPVVEEAWGTGPATVAARETSGDEWVPGNGNWGGASGGGANW